MQHVATEKEKRTAMGEVFSPEQFFAMLQKEAQVASSLSVNSDKVDYAKKDEKLSKVASTLSANPDKSPKPQKDEKLLQDNSPPVVHSKSAKAKKKENEKNRKKKKKEKDERNFQKSLILKTSSQNTYPDTLSVTSHKSEQVEQASEIKESQTKLDALEKERSKLEEVAKVVDQEKRKAGQEAKKAEEQARLLDVQHHDVKAAKEKEARQQAKRDTGSEKNETEKQSQVTKKFDRDSTRKNRKKVRFKDSESKSGTNSAQKITILKRGERLPEMNAQSLSSRQTVETDLHLPHYDSEHKEKRKDEAKIIEGITSSANGKFKLPVKSKAEIRGRNYVPTIFVPSVNIPTEPERESQISATPQAASHTPEAVLESSHVVPPVFSQAQIFPTVYQEGGEVPIFTSAMPQAFHGPSSSQYGNPEFYASMNYPMQTYHQIDQISPSFMPYDASQFPYATYQPYYFYDEYGQPIQYLYSSYPLEAQYSQLVDRVVQQDQTIAELNFEISQLRHMSFFRLQAESFSDPAAIQRERNNPR